jgi:hypothetical protein
VSVWRQVRFLRDYAIWSADQVVELHRREAERLERIRIVTPDLTADEEEASAPESDDD